MISDSIVGILPRDAINLRGEKKIQGDPTQLSLMFVNLIKNAKEAFEKSCKINISVYFVEDRQHIELCDNGSGFSDFDNVLTPFYTTKQGGSGIGLPMCLAIARNHNGILKFENPASGGAKTTITWPITKNH